MSNNRSGGRPQGPTQRSRAEDGCGMFIQMEALSITLYGIGNDLKMMLVGVIMFALGFWMYCKGGFQLRRYLRDWAMLLMLVMGLTAFAMLVITLSGEWRTQPKIVSATMAAMGFTVGLWFLWHALRPRYPGEYTEIRAKNAAPQAQSPAADAHAEQPVQAVPPAPTPQPRNGSARPAAAAARSAVRPAAPVARPAAPAAKPVVSKPKPAPVVETAIPNRFAQAADLEELYVMIDEEADALEPLGPACFTSAGQRMLLDAAILAVPRLSTLLRTGFPGERLLNADNGADAYEAMQELLLDVGSILGGMTRDQTAAAVSGLDRDQALMAWKAFRFYAGMSKKRADYDVLFNMLSDKF